VTFEPLAGTSAFATLGVGATLPPHVHNSMSQTRYQILGTIGVGTSSRVDKARDTLIDRTVVLKTFTNGFGSPDLTRMTTRI
jgi:hypothetical protein